MRVAFLGTSPFAVPTLDALLASEHEVVGVVTGPDKPAGRGRSLKPTPVKMRAIEAELPVLTPEKLKDPEFLKAYSEWKADAAVVVAFRILPKEVFDLPKYGTLNLHPSLLPRYRGPAPLNWAIINGDSETGISVIRIAKKVDAGGVVLQKSTPLSENENADQLARRLAPIGGQMIVDALDSVVAGTLKPIPQDEALVTKAPKLSKEDGLIDWNSSAENVHNRIRGVFPWPGAYTFLNGKVLKLYDSFLSDLKGETGEICSVGSELIVACGKGSIGFREVQLQGKKRMSVSDFIKGHPLEKALILGK